MENSIELTGSEKNILFHLCEDERASNQDVIDNCKDADERDSWREENTLLEEIQNKLE